jgi:hypothetical protein
MHQTENTAGKSIKEWEWLEIYAGPRRTLFYSLVCMYAICLAATTATTATTTEVGNDYILVQYSSLPQWTTTPSSINHMIDCTNPEKTATSNSQQQRTTERRKTPRHKRQWKDGGGGATVATPACLIVLC